MSRIQTIEPNYLQRQQKQQSQNVIPTMPRKNYQTLNFAGSEAAAKNVADATKLITKGVEAKLDKKMGTTGKFFQWLADGKGEIQTQTINNTFTTTLAPLMIVFNPFTKNKTKEDIQYLAWRQPISAVLAMSAGLAMTLGLNKVLSKSYNEGHVKAIDLRLKPSKEYLKKPFNEAFKEAQKKGQLKEFLAKYDSDVSNAVKENGFKDGKVSSAYKKGCLNGYVKKVGSQREGLFATLISEKPENIKIDDVNNLQKDHLVKVPNLNTEADLNKYIEANSLHNRTFGDFMKDKFKIEFHEEGELKGEVKSNIINNKLSEIKALDFMEEFGLIPEKSITESDLKEALLKYRQSLDKNKASLAKPIHGSAADAEELFNVIGKDTSRNIQMTVGEEIGKAKSITLGQLFHQVDFRTKNGKLQNLMDMKMSDALMKFKDIFVGKIDSIKKETSVKDFAINIIKKTAGRISKNAETHKSYIGIITNLGTTAISCTALNWAYPRFIEAFAPHLLKGRGKPVPAKQPEIEKGGNK